MSPSSTRVVSTPRIYRVWTIVIAVLFAVGTLAASASAARLRHSTRRARTTSGPILVATQQLTASLSEADAAATAAFLSGRDEDPEQRRLYEQALARATEEVGDIASLAGSDADIQATGQRIAVQLTHYAGLIEAARASNRSGASDANGYITGAVGLATSIVGGDIATLTHAAQRELQKDEDGRTSGLPVTAGVLIAVLIVLVAAQALLVRNSRRILNFPLVLGTVLVVLAAVWLVRATQSSGDSLGEARDRGFDSIVLTADLSTAGFGAKADETLALITGDLGKRTSADAAATSVAAGAVTDKVADAIRSGAAGGSPGGLLGRAASAADSPRERAAVAEAAVRWERYKATVTALRAAPNAAAARTIATGTANASFNGFNFSIESILGQNRGQFLQGLSTATNDTRRLPVGVPLLLVVALVVALWGFQLRINDYR